MFPRSLVCPELAKAFVFEINSVEKLMFKLLTFSQSNKSLGHLGIGKSLKSELIEKGSGLEIFQHYFGSCGIENYNIFQFLNSRKP